jgi:hypothetical protein
MDGTSKYINLRTGPGGVGMPPGSLVGDIFQWNGAEWVLVQLDDLVADAIGPTIYNRSASGEIPNVAAIGKKLGHVTMINLGANSVNISLGYSNGGTELLDHEEIEAGGWIDIPVNRRLSFTSALSLWLDASTDGVGSYRLIVETN